MFGRRKAFSRAAARAFDESLASANAEYAAKRADGRLAAPVLLVLAPGSLARQRRAAVEAGRPEGQVKPLHLVPPAGKGPVPAGPCAFFDHVAIAARSD